MLSPQAPSEKQHKLKFVKASELCFVDQKQVDIL